MPWYRQGTASVSNGSTAVAGTTTGWLSQAKPGDGITFNNGANWYEIAAVNSNTSITLATAFAQTTVSGGAYAIDRRSPSWTLSGALAEQLAEMIARSTRFNVGTGAPSNSLGADGDFYVRSDVPTIYGPKAGGVWPAGTPWQGGIPTGGSVGQVLRKASGTNYDVAWVDPRYAGQNLIINPRMNINQRGFAGGALAAGAYGYDRWRGGTGGCNVTISATTDTITHTSGNLEQIVEWAAWDTMRSQDLCFSVTDLSGGSLRVQADGVTVATLAAGSGVIPVTWNRGASNANMTIGLFPTSGAVSYKWPQLTIGSTPMPWAPRSTMLEQQLCERYFMAFGGQGGAVASIIAPSFAQSTVLTVAILQLRTRMRTSPSVSFVGTPADDFAIQVVGNTTLALSALALGPITPHSVQFNITPSVNQTAGYASSFRLRTTTARIYLDAEL